MSSLLLESQSSKTCFLNVWYWCYTIISANKYFTQILHLLHFPPFPGNFSRISLFSSQESSVVSFTILTVWLYIQRLPQIFVGKISLIQFGSKLWWGIVSETGESLQVPTMIIWEQEKRITQDWTFSSTKVLGFMCSEKDQQHEIRIGVNLLFLLLHSPPLHSTPLFHCSFCVSLLCFPTTLVFDKIISWFLCSHVFTILGNSIT